MKRPCGLKFVSRYRPLCTLWKILNEIHYTFCWNPKLDSGINSSPVIKTIPQKTRRFYTIQICFEWDNSEERESWVKLKMKKINTVKIYISYLSADNEKCDKVSNLRPYTLTNITLTAILLHYVSFSKLERALFKQNIAYFDFSVFDK